MALVESVISNPMDNPRFRAWFGNSKVVDDQGNPRVVHHGTPHGKFDAFDMSRARSTVDNPASERGIFFLSDRDTAHFQYGYRTPHNKRDDIYYEKKPHVLDAFLRIENPYVMEPVHRIKDVDDHVGEAGLPPGHDGLIAPFHSGETLYMVLRPDQVKSVTNSGAFSRDDDRLEEGDSEDTQAGRGHAMRWSNITEASPPAPMSDSDLYERGYQDGLRGQADFYLLGTGRPNENAYWQGFDYGKSKQPTKPESRPMKRLRQTVPPALKGQVRDADLAAAYDMMRQGHAIDGVQNMPAREPEEAIHDIANALRELAAMFDGSIRLYRTIQVEDQQPIQWVRSHLGVTRRPGLGRYWSTSENYVMPHEDNERVLFCVDAPGRAIDWAETIVTTSDGVEGEVRLRTGAAIPLVYVEPCDHDFTPERRQVV